MDSEAGISRYHRQEILPFWGKSGQEILSRTRATIVGCGAIGSSLANFCTRVGFGFIRLIDADTVTIDNLHRQLLFTEDDYRQKRKKVVAAKSRLAEVNSECIIETHETMISDKSVERLLLDSQIVFDGTDNFAARYLINSFCLRNSIPWIYAGVLSSTGFIMPIKSGETACLHCLYGSTISDQDVPTTRSEGILPTIVAVTAAWSVTEGIKLLFNDPASLKGSLIQIDIWQGSFHIIPIEQIRESCPACKSCDEIPP